MNVDFDWLERTVHRQTNIEVLTRLWELKLLPRNLACEGCGISMSINKYSKVNIGYAWRCANRTCLRFKTYVSIFKNSFFNDLNVDLRVSLGIIAKYALKIPRHCVVESLQISCNTVNKVIEKVISLIPATDFSSDKLGGPGKVVQIDETMLNYKCKSHRGRSPENRTDVLCIVECTDRIKRVYATCIENKSAQIILPIICSQVYTGSTIHTDDARVYQALSRMGFVHQSVVHKYNFVDPFSGVHSQAVESFNNILKYEIKKRKGIRTVDREKFCKEMCFLFNNKNKLLEAILTLLIIN